LRLAALAVLAFGLPLVAPPTAAANADDPRDIMRRVYARDVGDKMSARLRMTIRRSGKERTRDVRVWSMSANGSRLQTMIFASPADVRGTGLLSIDYHDGNKSDDQWIYVPGLRKSTRIAGGDRSQSFMGSDFTYSDLTAPSVDDFDYRMLEASAKVNGEDCWLIESKPKSNAARQETGYDKRYLWVSKTRLVPVQVKAWLSGGRRMKYIKFSKIEKVGGVWFAHRAAAQTRNQSAVESTTTLSFDAVKMNDPSVTQSLFSLRRLEQGL